MEEFYYLEYSLANEEHVLLRFSDINQRDGCYISLDMYKAQLGPITLDVLENICKKFSGERMEGRLDL